MPNLTIYVPDDLAAELRNASVPVSKVCQAALRRKLRIQARRAQVQAELIASTRVGVQLDARTPNGAA